jgi:predicted signal transduction protein with EAL and GGDEF domain
MAVAGRLKADLREGEALFRLGGDEFTVICATRVSAPVNTAHRLLATLVSPFLIEGNELNTGASLGVAQAISFEEVKDLMRWADTAMYHAKDAGRNTVRMFETGMSDKGRRLSMSNDLTKAIDNGEFALAFQAIVDLSTGQIEGAEALLRWVHPTRGVVVPDDFMAFAEETGQIVSIGRWVLLEACRQAARWPTSHGQPYVTVNISPTELVRTDFVAHALHREFLEVHQVLVGGRSLLLGRSALAWPVGTQRGLSHPEPLQGAASCPSRLVQLARASGSRHQILRPWIHPESSGVSVVSLGLRRLN